MAHGSAQIVLIHGAATTSRVWDRLIPLLKDYDVITPERPRTGDLPRELDWLAQHVLNSYVVGMSGGATLGLALAMSEVPLVGALLHEPAVGRLSPGLLAPMAAAFDEGGTAAFGNALYGPSWTPAMSGPVDDSVTGRELAMFRSFEPGPPSPVAGEVVITYGSASLDVRKTAATQLGRHYGCRIAALEGAGHFVAYDHPQVLADAIKAELSS